MASQTYIYTSTLYLQSVAEFGFAFFPRDSNRTLGDVIGSAPRIILAD